MGAKSRPPYPAAFRAEAVQLVQANGRSLTQAAKDLGVHHDTLRTWVKQAAIDGAAGRPDDGGAHRAGPAAAGGAHLKGGEGDPAQGGRVFRGGERDPVSCYRFIAAEAGHHPVALSCRVLGVSRAGYYAWRERPPSARARADAALTDVIHAIHRQSRGAYGAPRVHAELQATGRRHGRKRVARLLRQAGLQGCHRRRRRPRTTVADPAAPAAPNLVQRRFDPLAPDRLWLADITYVPTGEGWLYLAAVLDAFSRRVVGWAMADHLRTELVLDALTMALATRRPAAGLVHHSDRGCQYTALAFGRRLRRVRGGALDEPGRELLGQRRGRELLRHPQAGTGRPPRPPAVAHPGGRPAAIFDYVEVFYNRQRRHSTLRYLSPAAYEAAHQAAPTAAVA